MLTTKEFIKEVEKLGLEVDEVINTISIYDGNDELAYIRKDKRFYVCTYFEFSEYLSEELQEKLYNLIDDYARTPLEEREEPQKVYLRFAGSVNNGIFNYLNYDLEKNFLRLNDSHQLPKCKTQFTQKEIDEIKEKFGVTLSDFMQIPVNEDDKIKEDEEIE